MNAWALAALVGVTGLFIQTLMYAALGAVLGALLGVSG